MFDCAECWSWSDVLVLSAGSNPIKQSEISPNEVTREAYMNI